MKHQTAYIITGVKLNQVPMDKGRMVVHRAPEYTIPVASYEEHDACMAVKQETVEPFHVAHAWRDHRNPDPYAEPERHEYFIFMPLEVQKSMGMLYEVWADMGKENDKLRQRIHSRKAEGWFKRVHRAMVNDL